MGFASLTTEMKLDFPTFGKPKRPTSARSLSSSVTSHSSPGAPAFAKRGVWRVGVAKWQFPQPPLPPFAATNGSSEDISHITAPLCASRITVPGGTRIIRSSPFFPLFLDPEPSAPLGALYLRLYLKSARVEMLLSATKTTSPPFPPSPPSGPPEAIYFSRWKATAPWPPSPALIKIFALSTNIMIPHLS